MRIINILRRRVKVTGMVLLMSTSAPCAYADWVPDLQSSSGLDYSMPADSYRINIPLDVSDERLARLSLELDAIDVTAMIVMDRENAIFTPPQPLEFGNHSFRLVEYAPDGNILELGYWQVEVRQSASFQAANLEGSLTGTANKLVADNINGSRSLEGSGSLLLNGSVADKNWQTDGNVQLSYNSQKELTVNDRALDMYSYLLAGEAGAGKLNVGHHLIPYNSLILDGFDRRGMSASYGSAKLKSRATVFAMRPDQLVGFKEGLGVTNPNNRVAGVIWEAQPLNNESKTLYLSAAYLSGTGETDGTGVTTFVEEDTSKDWTLIADSTLLDGQVRFRGEYADSAYDFDGGGGFSEEDDYAYSLLARYEPVMALDQKFGWNIQLENRRVGTFFKSLANPTLPSDRDVLGLSGQLSWTSIYLNLSAAQEEDNVDGSNSRPTVQTRKYEASVNYNPLFDMTSEVDGWFGSQSYSLNLIQASADEARRPARATVQETDNRTQSASINARYNYLRRQSGLTGWGIGYAYGNQSDFTDMVFPDTNTHTARLDAVFGIGSRFSIAPYLQYIKTEDTDNGVDVDTTLLGLYTNIIILPNRLTGDLTASLNRNKQSDDTIDERGYFVEGNLRWNWIQPRQNRPGFDVSLAATYDDTRDDTILGTDNTGYQVYLKFDLTVPIKY